MIRVVVNRTEPEPALLDRAAAVIREGGLVALPTDTLYGLAADPFNAAAVRRVFLVKGRTLERALPLVAADVSQIVSQLGSLPPIAIALAGRFWPGPLTMLLPASGALAPEVTGGTDRVGVRGRVALPRTTQMMSHDRWERRSTSCWMPEQHRVARLRRSSTSRASSCGSFARAPFPGKRFADVRIEGSWT